jgi:hypothetical protein
MTDGLFYGQHETVDLGVNGSTPGAVNDATARVPVGAMFRFNGAVYRYVKHDPGTAVATVAGGVAYWKSLSPSAGTFTVSSDQTDSIAAVNGVAGVYGGVITATYYTFIQVGGVVSALTASGMAAGDLATGGSTDMTFEHIDAGSNITNQIFGIAISARNGTTGKNSILLQSLMW